ncbi:CRISPR-associated negative autoregulator [Rippkaea orientalis PCC 8801]|uniref:CRISPR-associated negative autoregulator n=1 Tax=Rippkaea orientalis (strain PCC 8801 / RF-1) TaxID=41431 RepID=B7JW16_RIPO1|nr:CRISPR-associated negative autoregulator [Rippkaea orientalis]ACK65705.1 CRISPR-associated negative autoregulator [Rippkaea orientalis PCC 8801]
MNQKKNKIPNYYLYGTVLTRYGLASLSHGMRQGNKSILQKAYWDGKIHSLVGSSSLRWALRFYLQEEGYPVNRVWDKDEHINRLTDDNFNPDQFYDDDIFGFALLESVEEETVEDKTQPSTRRRGKRKKSGTTAQRTGALSMNNAISLTPYDGSLKLGAKSGRDKDSTSLHFTEYHNTRYQYYFGLNATHLKDCSRIFPLIDGIMDMPKVGGSANIFSYPFCPDSLVFQWTNHFASYISYCFESVDGKGRNIKLTQDFINEVECGQINPDELWIGGAIVNDLRELENFEKSLLKQIHLYRNRNELVADLKEVIKQDLGLKDSQ